MGGSPINLMITPIGIGVAFVIGLIVCIIGGLFPARRASKMKTLEALKND